MKLMLLLTSLLIFIGCGTYSASPSELPSRATNIQDIGNGWVIFHLAGNKFMYHKAWSGNKGYESITQIIEE